MPRVEGLLDDGANLDLGSVESEEPGSRRGEVALVVFERERQVAKEDGHRRSEVTVSCPRQLRVSGR